MNPWHVVTLVLASVIVVASMVMATVARGAHRRYHRGGARRPSNSILVPVEQSDMVPNALPDAVPTIALVSAEKPDPQPVEHGLAPMPDSSPELTWLKGVHGIEGDFLLSRPINSVGRSRDCEVSLSAPTVSRQHCRIAWHGNGWFIESNGRNGTAVNDTVLLAGTTMPLIDGDTVSIGNLVQLRLVMPRSTGGTPALTLDTAGASAVGNRPHNEDAYHADSAVIAVADGVGGRPAGEVAARLCMSILVESSADLEMPEIVTRMNDEILRQSAHDPARSGMATTLDAARLHSRGGVQWLEGVHIGDSFAVLQDGDGITWQTRPHTWAAALVAAGQMEPSELAGHPDESRLVRALGISDSARPDFWQHQALVGQRLILFSDGLHHALGTAGINQAVAEVRDLMPEEAATRLVERALRTDANSDNVTVVIADVVSTSRIQ